MVETGIRQQIIVVGCGRVGAELALSLYRQEHIVSVVDMNPRSFDRLGPQFRGITVQGEGIDQDALKRAGIETADALAAVTASDSVNIVCSRLARNVYHLKHIIARVYNPVRMPIYENLGLQAIASSSWGARRIEQLILHPGLESVYSVGHGEVQIYEISVPEAWNGRTIGEMIPAEGVLPVSIVRGGHAYLPDRQTVLQTHDLLQVSSLPEGAAHLQRFIHGKGGG
ncbi:MAG TPA: TrkA family potassium uptake protein [Nitrospirota bacterium]|nr:TrkA family potassium uptake protein [Nitrospirota bacterium]